MIISFVLALLCTANAGFTFSSLSNVDTDIRIVDGPPIDNHAFEIRASLSNTHGGRVLDFLFSTTPVPRFVLRVLNYDINQTANSALGIDAAQYLAVRWGIWKVLEYNSSAGYENSPYDPDDGHHTIVSEHFLWDSPNDPVEPRNWSNLHYGYTVVNTSAGPVDVHEVSSFLSNRKNGFILKLTAFFATHAVMWGNAKTTIHPNEVKWGVDIFNYPYKSNNTRLAVKIGVDTKSAILDPPPPQTFVGKSPGTTDPSSDYLDLGHENYHVFAHQVEINGTGCNSTANLNRTVVKIRESVNDTDVSYPLKSFDPDDLQISNATRIVYFSVLPVPFCQPFLVSWDPSLLSDQPLNVSSMGSSTGMMGSSTGIMGSSAGASGAMSIAPSFLLIAILAVAGLKGF
jgi:hypothetical protein